MALLGALALILSNASQNAPRAVAPDFIWPLDNTKERALLLDFGMYVTPNSDQNPIEPPERWTGYHAAQDIEIFPDEINKDVPVVASCRGSVIFTGEVNGYGGVLVQTCELNTSKITVLYGHIDPHRILKRPDDLLDQGDIIGYLGEHKTRDAGYNRKHVHFQMHKGTDIVLRGYTSTREQLQDYINPIDIVNK